MRLVVACLLAAGMAAAQDPRALARDIFRQLIEINTTDSAGSVTRASEAVKERLSAAGYPDGDLQVLGSDDRHRNLVLRLHGTGAGRPVLFNAHFDVVEARHED